MRATYRSWCKRCQETITPGDEIARDDAEAAGYEWVHVECPDPIAPVTRTVCSRCFQEMSVTGACGCD